MADGLVRFKNRELSWLSFNGRVLQEAASPDVPLYERVKFLAIFSSNIDEFFRVRVAHLRAMMALKGKTRKKFDLDPAKVLKRIRKVVEMQQSEFGRIFESLVHDLQHHRIILRKENELSDAQAAFARTYFHESVAPHLRPVYLDSTNNVPFLENRALYLTVKLVRQGGDGAGHSNDQKPRYALVNIPVPAVARFVSLPPDGGRHVILFVDDVIRLCLGELFPGFDIEGAFAVKLTRDAGLYIDDEYSGDLLEKIKKALRKRDQGVPSRFLFDGEISKKHLKMLQKIFLLSDSDMIRGGRYHNFNDFFAFPNPLAPSLEYEPMPQISTSDNSSIFHAMEHHDLLLYYPYHSYRDVIRFFSEAADDPDVTGIAITLYRVARDSRIIEQLVRACRNGKRVTAFFEVKARFDEESNIRRAEELQQAGAKVLYSIPGLKVHAKLGLVTRRDGGPVTQHAYLSTGNFNEKAAEIYTDFGFFTTRKEITGEVMKVFDILEHHGSPEQFSHLLVAPFTLRSTMTELIDDEIRRARKGRPAFIIAKMNSLQDPDMIDALYRAGMAGVKIRLIVRGICCLIPGVKGMSENITVMSIVDRFLEHARVYWFHHGGDDRCYLSSADWMTRNLSRRIEVAFPVADERLRTLIRETLELQLNDSVKARVINRHQDNTFRNPGGGVPVRSQYAIYELLNRG
jgi:polyphosphate kinase